MRWTLKIISLGSRRLHEAYMCRRRDAFSSCRDGTAKGDAKKSVLWDACAKERTLEDNADPRDANVDSNDMCS